MYLYMKNILNVPANSALWRELLYIRDKDFFSLMPVKGSGRQPNLFPRINHVIQTFCLSGQLLF